MSFQWRRAGAALAVLALGCKSAEETQYKPPPPCMGMFCGSPSGGGVGPSGSGGAGGAATGSSIDVTGIVQLVNVPDFESGVTYMGQATIEGLGPGGKVVTATYGAAGAGGAGGGSGTSFQLDGVDSGPGWLVVQDTSGGAAGILSTFSPQDLAPLSQVSLPVIDLATLQNVASDLPSLSITGVDTSASQVILHVIDVNTAPLAGVSVTGNPVGGSVVYDVGDGTYDDTATATGSGGTIILFNGGLSGNATLTLSYTSPSTMMPTTRSITVQGSAGAATVGTVQLL